MAEPAFWQYPLKLNREPICTEMIRKYDNLYIELTQFAVSGAEYCFPYFNPTGVDPATGKRHHLYTGQCLFHQDSSKNQDRTRGL